MAAKILAVGECNRVENDVDPPVSFADRLVHVGDLLVAGGVALDQERVAEPGHRLFDGTSQPFVQVCKRQVGARVCECLGDCPRDAALIRHTEYDASFSG